MRHRALNCVIVPLFSLSLSFNQGKVAADTRRLPERPRYPYATVCCVRVDAELNPVTASFYITCSPWPKFREPQSKYVFIFAVHLSTCADQLSLTSLKRSGVIHDAGILVQIHATMRLLSAVRLNVISNQDKLFYTVAERSICSVDEAKENIWESRGS